MPQLESNAAARQIEASLTSSTFEQLTDIRITNPQYARNAATERRRRSRLTTDGRLNILACDHPARMVVSAGGAPLAMADRRDFLTRVVRILAYDAVDGVMATMDVLEELFILDGLVRKLHSLSFLQDKLMIASLNRGGLKGSAWELNDPVSSATPVSCDDWCLDGAKFLLRICLAEKDSLATLQSCIAAINQLNEFALPTFLEPLPVVISPSGYKIEKTAAELAKIVGVASALGDSSRYMWLKLPYCEDFSTVARATSLPILLLGGDSVDAEEFLNDIRRGLSAHHNVRGTMVGRNVLYPTQGDPVQLALSVQKLVHAS